MATQKNRSQLEALFSSGLIPTEDNFADFIASGINQKEDGLTKSADPALKIQGSTPLAGGIKNLILFYNDFDLDPVWKMRLRGDALEINKEEEDGLVYSAEGNFGIGTSTPTAKLEVNGTAKIDGQLSVNNGPIIPNTDESFDDNSGILFLKAPGDYSHRAYIRYGHQGGDNYTLEIGNGGGSGDHLSLVSVGNVGIGTASPTAKFHINTSSLPDDNTSLGFLMGEKGKFVLQSNDGLGRMTVLRDGNVGIGVANPTTKLQVGGDTRVEGGLTVSGAANIGNSTLSVLSTGKVGIGIANPTIPLEVGGAAKVNGELVVTGTADIGGSLSVTGGTINPSSGSGDNTGILFTSEHFGSSDKAYLKCYDRGGDKITLEIGTLNDDTDHIALMPSGNVGIGTNNPDKAKLVVEGSKPHTFTADGKFADVYSNSNGDYLTDHGHSASSERALSAYFEKQIACEKLIVFSDARIKNVLGRSDAAQDLQTLLNIQVSDYRLKDRHASQGPTIKKVIAQQVEEFYPQAVSQIRDVVPDIQQMATVEKGWIKLKTDLAVGERVKVISPQSAAIYTVEEIREDAFRVKLAPAVTEVFVQGREVDDFRLVDYFALSMLNMSATQGLYQQVQDLQEQLNAMKGGVMNIE